MIEKINQLLTIKHSLDDLNKKIDEEIAAFKKLEEQNKELRNAYQDLSQQIREIRRDQEEYQTFLKSSVKEIQALKNEMHSEVADFKVSRTKMNNDLLRDLANEFHDLFTKNMEKMETDVDKYNELKKGIADVSRSVAETNMQLNKFITISKTIKESDYSLVRHKQGLDQANREKLELMKKVDDLQRLISRERRRT